MSTLETLNAGAIAGVASFVNRSGLIALEITHPLARGLVYLHGAHVASYTPAGHRDLLWMSGKGMFADGKPIRGGVPICFPWFGPKADNPAAPAHGIARLREWQVEALNQSPAGVSVTLVIRSSDADRALFPHPFELRHRITFGQSLHMELDLINSGAAPAKFEEALHSYFAVGDVRNIRIDGLEGVEYLDKVDGGKRKRQAGPITITAETDRPYLGTGHTTTITDPGLGRRIIIEKSGSQTTVVWNPWVAKSKAMPDFGDDEWTGMMCVETVNAFENAVVLAAGARHIMGATIRAEKLQGHPSRGGG